MISSKGPSETNCDQSRALLMRCLVRLVGNPDFEHHGFWFWFGFFFIKRGVPAFFTLLSLGTYCLRTLSFFGSCARADPSKDLRPLS